MNISKSISCYSEIFFLFFLAHSDSQPSFDTVLVKLKELLNSLVQVKSVIFLSFTSTLPNSKFGLNSLIECRATCTLHRALSGSFGSFNLFLRSIKTTNKSSAPLLSETSHNKSPLTATKNNSFHPSKLS